MNQGGGEAGMRLCCQVGHCHQKTVCAQSRRTGGGGGVVCLLTASAPIGQRLTPLTAQRFAPLGVISSCTLGLQMRELRVVFTVQCAGRSPNVASEPSAAPPEGGFVPSPLRGWNRGSRAHWPRSAADCPNGFSEQVTFGPGPKVRMNQLCACPSEPPVRTPRKNLWL